MKPLLTILGSVVLGILLSTAIQAQKTSAAHDETVDFTQFKTFTFDEGKARNPFVDEIIRNALTRELTLRGVAKVENNPDMRVSYLAATDPNLRVADVPFYHVINPAYSGMIGSATMNMWDVTTGTLIVDLWDLKTDRVVFRGTITEVLKRAPSVNASDDAKMVAKPINKGVEKIFKKYPVKRK